ncbi:MAG: phage integrase N-terminal SAM-like domain-containing protein, partial [Spirochaetaceae bacterium]|nr:phage integrase N-terminal SAM-like domain-containing protein [Spirochaetaceae bacterium]
EALRLKHRSYQTEKSYIHWLDSFLVFLKNKNPDNIDIVVTKLPLYIKVPSRGTRSFV